MPAPTFKVILSALIAIGLSGTAVFHLPLVANWPYVGLLAIGVSAALGGIYFLFVRHDLRASKPHSFRWVARVMPFYFFVYSCVWSFVFLMTEPGRCREFSDGLVVKKYKSSNHGPLSVVVDLGNSGKVVCEGLSAETWEAVSPGSKVAKRCGSTDVMVLKR